MTTDGCSTGQSTCSIKAGLTPSSARTSRGTLQDRSPLPFRHWSGWAAALRAEYSARPRPVQATAASGFSYWPTARTVTGGGESAERKKELGREQAGGGDIQAAVEHWETPSVAVTTGTRLTCGGDRSDELLLSGQAVAASAHWSTPRASDGEKGGPNMSFGAGGIPLPTQAAHWPTPLTADDGQKVTSTAHQTALCNFAVDWAKGVRAFAMTDLSLPDRSTPSGPKSSETRRRLNPLFVEWLMGWPEGLSGFDTAAMASCHSPQPSHGCGCMDCWLTQQRAMLSDLLTIDPPAQGLLL